ncbi:succinylglutamate desuccinylase [Photobacterium nomapromontoriensis]|uniref:succinylglutamate desuccinylase n=1 Tax=Photobacterium nomapromontoriensis TaxID=2910237 RepID=UPI003D14BEB5
MGMLQCVQEGHFLEASLDMTSVVEQGRWQTEEGALCELLGRGILQITPLKPTGLEKEIVLSSGIHGDETSPVELIQQLVERIVVGGLQPVHRLLFIIGHPEAINHQQRFITENMNRLFKQKNTGLTADAVRANEIQLAISAFYHNRVKDREFSLSSLRWHLDLHCAIRDSKYYTFAVSPYTHKPTRSKTLFGFLQKAEIETVLLSNSPSSTFSWFSAEHFGAQALTLELGRVARFGENDLIRLAPFFDALVELVSEPNPDYHWQDNLLTIYKVTRTLVKQSERFVFSFPDDQANFTFYEQGRLLARDQNVEYYSLEGGEAIVFPNRHVMIGQRACLLVRKTEVNVDEQITLQ